MYRDSGKLRLFKKYGKFMDPKSWSKIYGPGYLFHCPRSRSYWSEKPNCVREICKERKLG